MMIGRNESVCAHIAVMRMTGLSGWHREPPAAKLYAVDPVGVATQIPSACTVVMWKLSLVHQISLRSLERDVITQVSYPKTSMEDIAGYEMSAEGREDKWSGGRC